MKKILLLCSMAVFMLVGCTESKIVNPDAESYVGEYDWNKAGDELNKAYKEDENSIITGIGFAVDEGSELISLGVTVKDGTTSEEAVKAGESVIKAFNDEIVKEDSNIAKSSSDSYGGLYQDYSIDIKVTPESTKSNDTTWLVNTTIMSGSDEKVVSVEEEQEEEQEEQTRDDMEEKLSDDQDVEHGPGTVPTEAATFKTKPE